MNEADKNKTKEQLMTELEELRQRIAELEAAEIEHKQAEEELRKSEERFSKAFNLNPSPTSITKVEDGRFFAVNESFLRVLGFKREEVLGLTPLELNLYVDHNERAKVLDTLDKEKRASHPEIKIRSKSGEVLIMRFAAEQLELDDEECIIVTAVDMTEGRLAEEALRESEKRYRSLFKNNHSVMLLVDPESAEIVDANPAACSFYGWTQEKLTSMKITDINMLPKEQVFQEIERAKSEARNHFFFRHRLANEEIRDVEVYSGPIRLHGKELLYSIIHDITERKHAEEALRKEKDRARRYLDTAEVIMVALNADERVELINMKGCEILGYDGVEIVGQNWFDTFIPEKLRENIRVAFERLLAGEKEAVEYYENPILTKDGEERLIAWHNTVFRNDEGDIVATLSSGEDITERKRADEELRALALRLEELEEAERRRLAQELHDSVGQNLTALSINLNFVRNLTPLGKNTVASDRLAECLSLVEETAEHIRNVMAELRPSVLDDYGLIAALHWHAERFSARTELTITLLPDQELKVKLPPIVETAIFRIVQEALTNVAKHAKASQITIQVEEIQGDVRLVVADDGVGFDPKILRQPGGQPAWGLVTMRERATAVGGHLRVNSEPGKGTQVVFEVKLRGPIFQV